MITELSAYLFNLFAVPSFLTAGIALLIGLIVLLRERGALISVLFFFVTLGIAVWQFSFGWMACASDPRVALWWAKSAYLGIPMIPAAAYHFTVTVLRVYPRYQRVVWFVWLLAFAFADALFLSDALIHEMAATRWGYYPRFGWLGIPYLLFFTGTLAATLALYLQRARRTPTGTVQHARVRAFLVAFSIALFGVADYLPSLGVAVYPFGFLPVLLALLLAARAIWRYRLVDLTPSFAGRQLMRTMPDGMLVVDLEGMIRLANSAACSVFHRRQEELVGEFLGTIEPAVLPAEVRERLLGGGDLEQYETVNAQGIMLRVSASALTDRAGQPVGLVCVVKDVTQPKRIEAALRASESRFARLAQSSIIGILIADLEGGILEANDAFLAMVGYTREDLLLGRVRWDALTPPEWRAADLRALEQLRVSGVATPWEKEYVRTDGERLPVLIGVTMLEGPEEQCIAFVLDMTEQKRAEQALKALNETLEERVEERSAAAEVRAQELATANRELDAVMQELRLTNSRLEALTLRDPLTDLLNRRGLHAVLALEVQQARRDGATLMALLVDLDNFKRVNDTYGYPVGDVVIKEMSRTLQNVIRATDHVARLGGDEFMILLPHTRSAEGVRVAEKIRLGIAASPVWISTGESLPVTASLGLVEVAPDTASLDELISHAHLALSESKQSGKNQVAFLRRGTPQVRAGQSMRIQLLTQLRRGDRLRAVLQPIFALQEGRVIGYEMLSRLSTETFNMPDDFFRLCMEANMLTVVDHQCFKTCLQASTILPPLLRRHLNLFPSTLMNLPMAELFAAFAAGIPAASYCIEVSEQQIIGDPSYLVKPVEALKRAGVQIAIDDVGFGRSSLESLIVLEPQLIKIDKKWVSGITRDASRTRSLTRLLRVASALGTEVVAEGIEHEDDLSALAALGVQYGQGYLLGRPVSPEVVQEKEGVGRGSHRRAS